MSRHSKLLGVVDITEQQDLPAGRFSSWLSEMASSRVTASGVDVPCGECNACCRSSYFINIEAQETAALARIPEELLVAAPGGREGEVVMGYDENGHCPMLVDDRCSIYEYRPMACRNYDCRIFPAAGIEKFEESRSLISQRTRRWKFSYPAKRDRDEHSAVRAAAKFLTERAEVLDDLVPRNSAQLAMLAVRVHAVFLEYQDEDGKTGQLPRDHVVAEAIRTANR